MYRRNFLRQLGFVPVLPFIANPASIVTSLTSNEASEEEYLRQVNTKMIDASSRIRFDPEMVEPSQKFYESIARELFLLSQNLEHPFTYLVERDFNFEKTMEGRGGFYNITIQMLTGTKKKYVNSLIIFSSYKHTTTEHL